MTRVSLLYWLILTSIIYSQCSSDVLPAGAMTQVSGIVKTTSKEPLKDDIVSPSIYAPVGSVLLVREVRL